MMKKRKIVLMILVVMGIVVLSACSSGEDNGSGDKKGAQRKESSTGLSQFADDEGDMWTDSWSTDTASGVSVNISTRALVELPKVKQMSTVEVQRYTFNEENKKKIAEAVFGGEVYYYDEEHLPKAEIQELLDTWQENEEISEKGIQELKGQEGKEKDLSDMEEELKEERAKVKRYEKLLKKASEDFEKVEGDYKGDEYIGNRDGIWYQLVFNTYEDGRFNDIDLFAHDQADIYPDGLKGEKENCFTNQGDIKLESENKCKMAKIDAEKTAREFLQKAGFSDLILAEEHTLEWVSGETDAELNDSLVNGWSFTFSPGAQEAPFSDYVEFNDYSGVTAESETEIISDTRFSPQCGIIISVTDKGVVEAKFQNPITFISSTPEVKLLPLEDIKKIIRDEIGEFAEFNYVANKVSSMNFNRLTLGYYRLPDPEHKDQYTYVPAWRLWSNSGNSLSFVVNAMDGSVVNDWAGKRKVTYKTDPK